ncbi:hypothetical protein ACSBR1_019054 [Camellia fascicularis]
MVLSFLMAETIAALRAAAGVKKIEEEVEENVEEIHYYLNDAVNNLVSVKMDFKNEVERNKTKKPSEAYLE